MTDVRTRKDRSGLTKAAWNERIKLFATSLHAIGLAVFGFGVLAPALGGMSSTTGLKVLAYGAIFVGLHVFAQWALLWLED